MDIDYLNQISEGNIDTENGRPGQMYKTPTNDIGFNDFTSYSSIGSGNANSDMGQWVVRDTYKGTLKNPVYYNQIGLNRDPDAAFSNLLGYGSVNGQGSAKLQDVEYIDKRQKKMDYYEQLGNALQQMMQGPKQQQQSSEGGYQSNLTGGFDQSWLMNQTNAGSANGAKI